MPEINSVGVIGLGALGLSFGAKIQETLGSSFFAIVDAERKARYEKEGFVVNGTKCNFNYATPSNADGKKADLLLISTKFGGLREAVEQARPFVGENTMVLSLLNGISSEGIIGDAIGQEKVLPCIAVGMDSVRKGNAVTYHNIGYIHFGEADGSDTPRVRAVETLLDRCGGIGKLHFDMTRFVWSKMMLNVGLNQVLAVFDADYGAVQQPGPALDKMLAAMREVRVLSDAEGVHLTEQDIADWMALVNTLSPKGCPSMVQDLRAKRDTELELFAGTVIRLGKKHGIATPVNDMLYEKIREMEAANRRQQ